MKIKRGEGLCSLCGENATACWNGVQEDVFLCARCAVNIMPALIADAIAPSIDHIAEIKATFWKAMAIAKGR